MLDFFAHMSLYVLYYCWKKGDRTLHEIRSNQVIGVCMIEECKDNGKKIVDWKPVTFEQPTLEELRDYAAKDIKEWYRVCYELPITLQDAQRSLPVVNSHDLAAFKQFGVNLMHETLVFNKTDMKWMLYDKASDSWKTATS